MRQTRTRLALALLCLLALALGPLAGGAAAQAPAYDSAATTDFSTAHASGAAGSSTVGSWIDKNGGVASSSGGNFVLTTSDSSGYLHDLVLRPASETTGAATGVVVYGNAIYGNATWGIVLHYNSATPTYYLLQVTVSGVILYKVSGTSPANKLSTTPVWAENQADACVVTAYCYTSGGNEIIGWTVYDATAATTISTGTYTDNSSPYTGAGQNGMAVWDNTGSATNSFSFSRVLDYAVQPLAVTPSTVAGLISATVSAAASGGTAPYNYQWYIGANPNFTAPGSGTAVSGATSATYTDAALTAGLTHWYECVVGDASGSGAVTTPPAPANLLTQKPLLKVGFIGDSITAGYNQFGSTVTDGTNDVCTLTVQKLSRLTDVAVDSGVAWSSYDKGVSGQTTAQWLPATGNFAAAESSFSSAFGTPSPTTNPVWVYVTLGTNDARPDQLIPAGTYSGGAWAASSHGANISAICSRLLSDGYNVLLNHPPYFEPFGAWTQAGEALNYAYVPVEAQVVTNLSATYPGRIYVGDTQALAYFAANPTLFQEYPACGVHPNGNGGTDALATLWAQAGFSDLNAAAATNLSTSGQLRRGR